MLNENARNEEIETQTSELADSTYFRKNPEAELQREKIKIQRRLKEINSLERNKEIKEQLLTLELEKRRTALKRYLQEKRLSQGLIDLFFQNSKVNPNGSITR